jgi:outer membrane protease
MNLRVGSLLFVISCLGLSSVWAAPAKDPSATLTPDSQKKASLVVAPTNIPSAKHKGDFKPFQLELAAGGGYMGGNVTYQIGDEIRSGGVVEDIWFPISELKWPINVFIASFDGAISVYRFEARGRYTFSVTDEAGTMEDSDWEYIPNPKLKTTYSETDAYLDFKEAEGSLRYWALTFDNRVVRFDVAGGIGYMYQKFNWDAQDGYQWTVNPFGYEGPINGLAIQYEAEVNMPYIELSGRFQWQDLRAELRGGFAPYMTVKDVDDHVLRYIRSETDADGIGGLGQAVVSYDLTKNFFVQLEGTIIGFKVDGTETSVVYAGEDEGNTWEIYHEVESFQARGTLALGAKF